MEVSPETAPTVIFESKNYYFCCSGCVAEFNEKPAYYRDHPAKPFILKPVQPDHLVLAGDSARVMHLCPMHPDVQVMGPSTCPLCGMDLEPAEIQWNEGPAPEQLEMMRRAQWSIGMTLPVLILAMVPMAGHSVTYARLADWIQAIVTTGVVVGPGSFVWSRALDSLRNRNLNMFSLIGLGTGVAFAYSWIQLILGSSFLYFESAAAIITLVAVGQVLELKARAKTGQAIRSLLQYHPKTAHRISKNGGQSELDQEIEIQCIEKNDHVRVLPGERIPLDGKVIEGLSFVDESMLSGESVPIEKKAGDTVRAGTSNVQGVLKVEVSEPASKSFLSLMVKKVMEAQRSRAPIQKRADQVAAVFVPVVLGVSLLTAGAWFILGPDPKWVHALIHAVSVLIIACPCALGLATPMSIMVAMGRGATLGILAKNAEALELLSEVDTVVFDKTGTLTEGQPRLTTIQVNGCTENEALQYAACLELNSEHPLARAFLSEARARGLDLSLLVDCFEALPGTGVKGIIGGTVYFLGATQPVDGYTSVELRADVGIGPTQSLATFTLVDAVKVNTALALSELKKRGLTLQMLTGDHSNVANRIAKGLPLDKVQAGVSPVEKLEVIKALQAAGNKVAMVGDGMNDSPALAQANVGIAMGTGTDIAIQSAGITLVRGDLKSLMEAIDLSKETVKNIRQNLLFAFFYNAIGIPIAAGALYPTFGLTLSPMWASAAMSLSSVTVILNALRLYRAK